ncbi:MAG: hypothetical protein CL677_06365 [Bdellovibrionaceae bacterium]|nr:hypothetical protein [Pseudobdellovibrionaceae bacterium]|tara:strand:- start:64564 stop:66426 length:1863 start_codon:yes stop_codon:yes gene_type:complete
MASVKIKWRTESGGNKGQKASEYERYVLKKATNIEYDGLNPGIAAKSIINSSEYKESWSKNVFFEVIQSFSHEDSEKLGADGVTDFGKEFVKRSFPNHEFLVVTHADTKHIHNHILINPINGKTKKREIINKKSLLSYARSKSNEISKDLGLSIIEETREARQAKLHPTAQKILERGGVSYQLDLIQRADLARSLATSFDEYISYMSELGIKVGVQKKNIQYLYPTKKKNIRGKKLGARYDKEGLLKVFAENKERFKSVPFSKERMRDEFNQTKDRNSASGVWGIEPSGELFGQKGQGQNDHISYSSASFGFDHHISPSGGRISDPIIPFELIQRANRKNLLEYCAANKISLMEKKNGQLALKGRPYVTISENGYYNAKNKTKGQYLDFVAIHKETTYIRALSEITGNKNLLLLENHLGKVTKGFNSFYIPNYEKMAKKESIRKLKSFFDSAKVRQGMLERMLEKDSAQVSLGGAIRFFDKGDRENGFEYTQDQNGTWSGKKLDKKKSASVSFFGPGGRAAVVEGADMLSHSPATLQSLFSKFDNLIFTDDRGLKSAEVFIGQNNYIKEVTLFTKSKGSQILQPNLDLFKTNLSKSGIILSTNDLGKQLERTAIDLDFNI